MKAILQHQTTARATRSLPAAARAAAVRGRRVVVCALPSRTQKLRELLSGPEIIKGPCCHDGISARLIEQAGFEFAFMSGFCTSAARLGAPDTGIISYYEMVEQGRCIHEATKHIPIIGDGDTGYGNAMNVKRTVRGYAAAGFAGILIEDQIAPKSCGHVRSKKVVSREEAVSRIRAAVDARNEGADILIAARTDARQAVSLEEALWRAQAFAEAGADILFIDALASVEEMQAFCNLGGAAKGVPKMANMLEGGGKTPILTPAELQAMGFSLVAYPLSLLAVSIKAMQDALGGLRTGAVPGPREMGTFVDLQMAVGFPEYYEEEARYAISNVAPGQPSTSTSSATSSSTTSGTAAAAAGGAAAAAAMHAATSNSSLVDEGTAASGATTQPPSQAESSKTTSSTGGEDAGSAAAADASSEMDGPVVEADEVVLPAGTTMLTARQAAMGGDGDARSRWEALKRTKFLRVVITDRKSGTVKLETRIPAGFLSGLAALIPDVAGINLEEMIEASMGGKLDPTQPLLNLDNDLDKVQVYLE